MMNRSPVLPLVQLPLALGRPSRNLVVGTLFLLSLMSSVLGSELAQAQSPAAAEMTQYTSIARQIERQRQQDLAEVQQLMGGKVPENVCQQSNLSQPVRKVCDRFDATSRDIITRNGMTVTKFNEIIRFCQQSPKPKECPK